MEKTAVNGSHVSVKSGATAKSSAEVQRPDSGVPHRDIRAGESGDGTWIVTYECESDERTVRDDEDFIAIQVDRILDFLPENSQPVVSAIGAGIHLTFEVTANAATAVSIGVECTWTALEACDLSDFYIVRAAQISLREHSRQLGSEAPRLRLLNASDCARELELTRQRVGQLITAGDFPEPDGVVGDRPVWLAAGIRALKSRRSRSRD